MPAKKDDLVLRPRWRTRMKASDLPLECHPAIIAVILEPEARGYLEQQRAMSASSTWTRTRLTACGVRESHQRSSSTRMETRVYTYRTLFRLGIVLEEQPAQGLVSSGRQPVYGVKRHELYKQCSVARPCQVYLAVNTVGDGSLPTRRPCAHRI